nr:kinetochore protein Nuf2-like [Aegilops tauschii subsp. strangulata]
MAAVTRRLRGRTDRIQAFAQAEVEATQELERAVFQLDSYRVNVFNRLLETHRRLKESLPPRRRSSALRQLVADVARLGAEAEKAKAEATGARQALDEASRLQEQLVGDKSRLEAEVERLKAEAPKVVEAQQALAEADQQRGKLADDRGQLQAEVERLKALVATAEESRQGETRLHEEAMKAAEDKDAELKAALAKVADLEKALEERDRTIARERRDTLLEAQHLEESFSRAFPETRQLAEEVVRFQRDPQGIVGSGTDPRVAWTFSDIVTTAEARLRVLSEQMGQLSEAGAVMTAALWPGAVAPTSFRRLAR